VREQAIATAVTDARGRWSLPVTLLPSRQGMSLRALYAGSSGLGAVVSEPLQVPGSVSLTPAPAGSAPASPPSLPAAAPPAM
jgi:hypothetical protein